MARYYRDLLETSGLLLKRTAGQRGKLSSARIRRSISTSYYALFHFILEECSNQVIGSPNMELRRRRIFARTLDHRDIRITLTKVSGTRASEDVAEFLRTSTDSEATVASPEFARAMARAFLRGQDLRHRADYDLNATLDELTARALIDNVRNVIEMWLAARRRPADREFKHALCLLMALGGRLRADNG